MSRAYKRNNKVTYRKRKPKMKKNDIVDRWTVVFFNDKIDKKGKKIP